jgi:hypothetical protein
MSKIVSKEAYAVIDLEASYFGLCLLLSCVCSFGFAQSGRFVWQR